MLVYQRVCEKIWRTLGEKMEKKIMELVKNIWELCRNIYWKIYKK